jgi:hypothetical protein
VYVNCKEEDMFTRRIYWIITMAAAMLLLAGCNLPGQQATPTTDPGLVYTQAAQSVAATLTQAAVGTPVGASTPTGAPVNPSATYPPTNTPLPSLTPLPSTTPVPPTATTVPTPCDRAEFVDDITIDDNTEIPAGTTFVKTWRLRNTGSCTWTSSYALIFYSGEAMSGPAASPLTSASVPPGSTIDISVTLIAPLTPGTYRGDWRLRNAAGATFGIGALANQSFWVQIRSVTPRTPTPTVTATPAVTVAFDFISRGPEAQWRNATTTIPWGDPPNDTPGVAVNVENVRMEDNTSYPRLLATYPQRITDGMIVGLYPSYTIQANDHFRARVGLRDDCDDGRVRFQVRYIEGGSTVLISEWVEACNDTLTSIDINLAALAGHTVQFELAVLADGPSDNDISLWVAPRIER